MDVQPESVVTQPEQVLPHVQLHVEAEFGPSWCAFLCGFTLTSRSYGSLAGAILLAFQCLLWPFGLVALG